MRLLCQKQGLYYLWCSSQHEHHMSTSISLAPSLMHYGADRCLTYSGFASHLGSSNFGEFTTFIASSQQVCPLSGTNITSSPKIAHCKHDPDKGHCVKSSHGLLFLAHWARCIEAWEIHEGLSPNTYLENITLIPFQPGEKVNRKFWSWQGFVSFLKSCHIGNCFLYGAILILGA